MHRNKYTIEWRQNIAKVGAFAVCTAGLLAAGVALASNIHFLALSASKVSDTEVLVEGTVAGLGNEDITITAFVEVEVSATCFPPGNSNKPPFGINKKLQADGEKDIPANKIKNGSVAFEIPIEFENLVTCPNKNWDPESIVGDIVSVQVEVVQQDGGGDSAFCDLTCGPSSCVIGNC